jgi:cytochrome c peroxidase
MLFWAACQTDDIQIPDPTDPGTPTDNNNNGGTATSFEILEQTPVLPATHFNYANQPLPPYVNAGNVREQDNTPNNNPVTDAGATLGRVLFYDKNMSANNTISCASCHQQSAGFSDPTAFSLGFDGGFTGRNSMGLANANFYENGTFFWDQRAATLEDQVLMPIQDHVEMGMSLENLVAKLELIDYYGELFTEAFGDPNITTERISLSLSQFIRSMVSYRSKFDVGLAQAGGNADLEDDDFPNFSAAENLGKMLFFSNRTNCSNCHGTPTFAAPGPRNNGLDLVFEDNGIGEVTGDPDDNGLFKVNSLKNIAVTEPYMHDGRFETLEEVIEHYNSGVQNHPNLSPQLRGGGGGRGGNNGQPRRLNLSQAEKDALVAFLETLTDEEMMRDTKFSDPFGG